MYIILGNVILKGTVKKQFCKVFYFCKAFYYRKEIYFAPLYPGILHPFLKYRLKNIKSLLGHLVDHTTILYIGKLIKFVQMQWSQGNINFREP